MAAVYPATTKTFPTRFNFIEDVDASHINDLQDEVAALQRVLGINPATGLRIDGTTTTWTSVGARVDQYGVDIRTHTHDGKTGVKLRAANTHENPDTDGSTTALHHTLGTGPHQAAAGDHKHDDRYSQLGHGHVITDVQNLKAELDGKAPVGHNHDGRYVLSADGHTDGVKRLYERSGSGSHVEADVANGRLRLRGYDVAGNPVSEVTVALADRSLAADSASAATNAQHAVSADRAASAGRADEAGNADTLGGVSSNGFASAGHTHNRVSNADHATRADSADNVRGYKFADVQFQVAPGGSFVWNYGGSGFTRNPSVVAQHMGGTNKDGDITVNAVSPTSCRINLSSDAPSGTRWVNAIASGT